VDIAITANDARRVVSNLLNAPIAPGKYSHFINVGTDHILDALDHNYFRGQLADGSAASSIWRVTTEAVKRSSSTAWLGEPASRMLSPL